MDCASCVAKVTRAVERLPGVSGVEVNLMAERLALSLAPGASTEAVEREVAALGYTATPLPGSDAARGGKPAGHAHAHGNHDDDPADAGGPWWRTGKAMLVWALGALVGGAYLLSFLLPG
ncbi:heavy metal translocating P-type ATPase, partial [Roseicella aquatilis]